MTTDDAGSVALDYESASRAIAKAVSLCEFSLKERRILTFILEVSFGAGRAEAFIPGLRYFAQATRVSEGNASQVLRRLKQCGVIEEQPKDYYAFLLPAENWKVPLQIDVSVLREVLDLRFDRDDLNGALRENFVATHTHLPTRAANAGSVRPVRSAPLAGETLGVQCRESAGSEQAGGGKPVVVAGEAYPLPLPNARPVPETGTAPSGSRFGNPAPETVKTPAFSASVAAVPVSGTSPTSLQAWNLGTKQDCKVPRDKLGTVPESGTLQPRKLGLGALSEDRQAAFDEMEALGFWKNDPSSKWNWLKFIKSVPLDQAEELIGEVRYRVQHPSLDKLRCVGAFANKTAQRWGLKW